MFLRAQMDNRQSDGESTGNNLPLKVFQIFSVSIFIVIGVNLFIHRCDGYNHNREKILTSRVIEITDVRFFTVILQTELDTYKLVGPSDSFRLSVQIGDSVIKPNIGDYCTLVHKGTRQRIRMIGPNPICGKED